MTPTKTFAASSRTSRLPSLWSGISPGIPLLFRTFRNFALQLLSLVLATWFASTCLAGASPSQWVVVVNNQSTNSKTVANCFVALRNIPSINVIYLDQVPDSEEITVDVFRETILSPVLKEMEKRGLQVHVQGIAYSSDFPTAINITSDLASIKDRPHYLTPVGSINGLTYLYRYILTKDPNVVSFGSNLYAGTECDRLFVQPFQGEDAQLWSKAQQLIKEKSHLEAARSLQALFAKHPRQHPVAFQSAVQFCEADEVDEAISMIEKALASGWSFRKKLETEPAFEKLEANNRFSALLQTTEDNDFAFWPTQAFNARAYWAPNGIANPKPTEGIPYMLSAVLGVTRGNGTTVKQSMEQLTQAAKADFTKPDGCVYFTKTADVRTKCREPGFQTAIDRLTKLGRKSEIVTSIMPQSKEDCFGVTMGDPSFAWKNSRSTLLPGSIAENLTSLGGVMAKGAGQTKLTELLIHGAAASSGTVTEPYSIQAKFPHPMIHAYYADGLTLAEAFYASITGPYQLLIVGDPLCQPFSHPPRFRIEGLQNGDKVDKKLRFQLTPEASDSGFGIAGLALLVDGRLRSVSAFAKNFDLNLTTPSPGAHELTLITTDDSPAQCKWEQRVIFLCGDESDQVTIEAIEQVNDEGEFKVRVAAPDDVDRIEILHHSSKLVELKETTGEVTISKLKVGYGPIRLSAIGYRGANAIASLPITVEIPLPSPLGKN